MNEELLKKMAIEIQNSCPYNCPCGENCKVANDEECMDRILNWLKSEECIDTVVGWVKSALDK